MQMAADPARLSGWKNEGTLQPGETSPLQLAVALVGRRERIRSPGWKVSRSKLLGVNATMLCLLFKILDKRISYPGGQDHKDGLREINVKTSFATLFRIVKLRSNLVASNVWLRNLPQKDREPVWRRHSSCGWVCRTGCGAGCIAASLPCELKQVKEHLK